MSRQVLVIEDSADIVELVSLHLGDIGCEVTVRTDGRRGFECASRGGFELIILDLMLPGMDGLEICAKLRAASEFTPILMLTARSSEVDRVVGLEMGADDYLVKPFNVQELLARVKAIFRRMEIFSGARDEGRQRVVTGKMCIDPDKRVVHLDAREIDLTAKEFDLLFQFAANPGRVYSRKQLLDLVWGYSHEGYEHTVNSHINRLRAKIEKDSAQPEYILTVWGVGYKFNDALGEAG